MDIKRASEIMASSDEIGVNYKGDPVWLENINATSNTVKIKNMRTNQELNADIRELEEE